MSVQEAISYMGSVKNFKLPRSELERLQVRRLRAVLGQAGSRVPAYREAFRKAGFDPAELKSVEDIRRLPTFSKADMLRIQRGIRTAAMPRGTRYATSSGTTGKRVTMASGAKRAAVRGAVRLRLMMLNGIRPWSRIATLWAPQRFWRSEVLSDGRSRPHTLLQDRPVWLFGKLLPNILPVVVDPTNPARDGRALKKFGPDFIYGRPSYLRRIARALGPELGVEPEAIAATGEVVTETGMRELRSAYKTRITRIYGSADVGGIAADCRFETGMHAWEDFMVYEVLKDGEQVSPGEVGELVLTFLFEDPVPRIRYRTGDYVKMAEDGPCACGSRTRRIASIEGREDDCLIGEDGERRLATEVADYFESALGMRDFRLVQRGTADFSLSLLPADAKAFAGAGKVSEYLEGLVGSKVDLEIEEMNPRDLWDKTRPVICALGRTPSR